jgi:hypothetical protein
MKLEERKDVVADRHQTILPLTELPSHRSLKITGMSSQAGPPSLVRSPWTISDERSFLNQINEVSLVKKTIVVIHHLKIVGGQRRKFRRDVVAILRKRALDRNSGGMAGFRSGSPGRSYTSSYEVNDCQRNADALPRSHPNSASPGWRSQLAAF